MEKPSESPVGAPAGGCGCVWTLVIVVIAGYGVRFGLLFIKYSWPICGILLAAVVLWIVAKVRSERDVASKGAVAVLGPVVVGLFLLVITLVVLNTIKVSYSPSAVHDVEDFLVATKDAIGSVTSIGLGKSLAVIAVVLVLTYLLPRTKAVTAWIGVQKWLGRTAVVLGVLTSFTLFSQIPASKWAVEAHTREKARYEALLKQEREAIARVLAAEKIRENVEQASPATRQAIAARFRPLTESRERERATHVLAKLSAEWFRARAESRRPPGQMQESVFAQVATDLGELRAQKEATRLAEVRVVTTERQATEAEVAAKGAIDALVGAMVPELGGTLGKFVSSLVGALAEKVYAPALQRWFETGQRDIRAVDAAVVVRENVLTADLSKVPEARDFLAATEKGTTSSASGDVVRLIAAMERSSLHFEFESKPPDASSFEIISGDGIVRDIVAEERAAAARGEAALEQHRRSVENQGRGGREGPGREGRSKREGKAGKTSPRPRPPVHR